MRLRIYLYHIPPIAQVGITLDLIERLVMEYPNTVVGIKDSSGDWDNTNAMLDRAWDDFAVFAGSESFLLATLCGGGSGCISATANINPAAIDQLFQNWQSDQAEQLQQELVEIRDITMTYPMIPALKAVVAYFGKDESWRRLRPPLVMLPDEDRDTLVATLEAKGFEMPGL